MDLLDMSDYETSSSKQYRYNLVVIDNVFNKNFCIPLKKKLFQRTKDEFSSNMMTSKRI